MITHPGEYHDATSTVPIPQSRQTLDTIERGRRLPPLPIQITLRRTRVASITALTDHRHIDDHSDDAEAA